MTDQESMCGVYASQFHKEHTFEGSALHVPYEINCVHSFFEAALFFIRTNFIRTTTEMGQKIRIN